MPDINMSSREKLIGNLAQRKLYPKKTLHTTPLRHINLSTTGQANMLQTPQNLPTEPAQTYSDMLQTPQKTPQNIPEVSTNQQQTNQQKVLPEIPTQPLKKILFLKRTLGV